MTQQPTTSARQQDMLAELGTGATSLRGVRASIRMGGLWLSDLESVVTDVSRNDETRLENAQTAVAALRQTFVDMKGFLTSNRQVLDTS